MDVPYFFLQFDGIDKDEMKLPDPVILGFQLLVYMTT